MLQWIVNFALGMVLKYFYRNKLLSGQLMARRKWCFSLRFFLLQTVHCSMLQWTFILYRVTNIGFGMKKFCHKESYGTYLLNLFATCPEAWTPKWVHCGISILLPDCLSPVHTPPTSPPHPHPPQIKESFSLSVCLWTELGHIFILCHVGVILLKLGLDQSSPYR